MLSALVVKGSFFIIVRLWFFVMPGLAGVAAPQLLGALGAGAIVFGSLLALRQERLKLLVAYSTVAQLGYLFLVFPLALDAEAGRLIDGSALIAGLIQAASHATAKAAMFMAAGMIYVALGHDRIAALGGVVRIAPLAALVFLLAGVALIGPPTSGVYLAKTLFLRAADSTHQWWWSIVLDVGSILTSAYLVMLVVHALAPPDPRRHPGRHRLSPAAVGGPGPRAVLAAARPAALARLAAIACCDHDTGSAVLGCALVARLAASAGRSARRPAGAPGKTSPATRGAMAGAGR